MDFLLLSILLLLVATITAHYAIKRGRSAINWFIIGALFGIMGLLLLFLLPTLAEEKRTQDSETDNVSTTPSKSFDLADVVNENKQKKWFYLDNTHTQQGPVDFEKLASAWLNKEISAQTFVWSEGMSDWKTIQELNQFQESLSVKDISQN
jgi:hypothetical protein